MLTRLNLRRSATGKGPKRAPRTKHSKAARRPDRSLPAESPPGKSQPWQSLRRKEVERAKKLVKDPNYPSPAVTKAVARLLAKNLQKLDDPASPIGV